MFGLPLLVVFFNKLSKQHQAISIMTLSITTLSMTIKNAILSTKDSQHELHSAQQYRGPL
jgi:murein endopeptidase